MVIIAQSCQSDTFRRPIVESCISNGDGSAECTFKENSYHQDTTVNFVCTSPESYGKYLEYVLELEERLKKCELEKP